MQIIIGTFNVMNLVLAERPFYGREKYSKADYTKKIDWIATQLRAMNADIVGFQEVFHREALLDAVKASGIYPDAEVIVGSETGELPRSALVSRFPITHHEVLDTIPPEAQVDILPGFVPFTQLHRPILKAKVKLPGGHETVVMVAHLKSKRPITDDNVDRHEPWEATKGAVRSLLLRGAEAAALRWHILKEIRGTRTPLIVLGDLNDADGSVTSEIIKGRSPHPRYPAHVKKEIWDIELTSCSDIQRKRSYQDVYYTHIHGSHYESLDHILVSEEFVSENPNRIGRVIYVRVFTDHLEDTQLTMNNIAPWVSDHGQVIAVIKLEEKSGR